MAVGRDNLQPDLVDLLGQLEKAVEMPVYITSGYREGDTKSHGHGLAVDISDNLQGKPIWSGWRHRVLKAAYALGFRRIGVYDRHIHLDLWEGQTVDGRPVPQDVTWFGMSE